MKAIARTASVVAVALVIAAVPVFAAEGSMVQQEPQSQNSECLLVARNCPTDSIQERIQRIQGEIAKGNAVYSNDELRVLNRQLEDAQQLLDYELTSGGGA